MFCLPLVAQRRSQNVFIWDPAFFFKLFLPLLPSARILFYSYACGTLTVCFLVAASGSNSKRLNTPQFIALPLLEAPAASGVKSINYEQVMQNKPNFRKSQMNVNKALTKNYENKRLCRGAENKPKTKPKQTQFPKSQNEIKLLFNKGL